MKRANAQRLKVAREFGGFTQTTLAKRVGISQSRISKAEKGLVTLPHGEAKKIASASTLRPSFLYGPTPPPTVALYRRRKRVAMKTLRQLEARFVVVREAIAEMASAVEFTGVRPLPRFSDTTPEEAAAMVRGAWAMPHGPIGNVTALVELAGVVVVPLASQAAGVDAAFALGGATCPPIIFIRNDLSGAHWRFTLAHELAHLVLHHTPGATLDRDAAEDEANRFATEWLAPTDAIKSDLEDITLAKALDLKMSWGVSMASMIYRARDLGITSASRHQSLAVMLSRKGYTRREPGRLPPEPPRTLQALIKTHLDRGQSLAQLAAMVHMTPDTFNAQFYPEPPPKPRIKLDLHALHNPG